MTREEECPACQLVERRPVNYSVEYDCNIMLCRCGAVLKMTGRKTFELADKSYLEKNYRKGLAH